MPRLSRLRFQLLISLVPAALCASLVGPAPQLAACNIPVFRYALERWHPDPYRWTVFHRGPLTDAQRKVLEPWEESLGTAPQNVTLRVVDVDNVQDEEDRSLLDRQKTPEFPWLVVQYPKSLRNDAVVWAGPLSTDAVDVLVGSPLRTELVRRLVDGQTAVLVMLESGDKEKDAKAAAAVEEQFKELAKKLELPELTAAPDDELRSGAPLQIAFSLLRVSRDAPGERALVDMLIHSEPDLAEFDEPMVFPVFGRGRALLPLIGAGITSDNIHESAAFLVGACSCEIKELNPGFDLLLSAEWDELLFGGAAVPEDYVQRTSLNSDEPELIAIPPGAPSDRMSSAAPELEHTTTAATTDATTEEANDFRSYVPAAAGVALLAIMFVLVFKR